MDAIQRLQTMDEIWRPYGFDRVEVRTQRGNFSILGLCWSDYRSGPNLLQLANAAAEITGEQNFYGLGYRRPLYFRSHPLP